MSNFVIENFSLKSLVLKILVMVTDIRTYGRTDGHTDGRTDGPSYRDARTHLKRASVKGGREKGREERVEGKRMIVFLANLKGKLGKRKGEEGREG